MDIQEKYAELSKKAKQTRNMVWATNRGMSTVDNPVLIQVSADVWNHKRQSYQRQGYVKFVPAAIVAPPIEAKKVIVTEKV